MTFVTNEQRTTIIELETDNGRADIRSIEVTPRPYGLVRLVWKIGTPLGVAPFIADIKPDGSKPIYRKLFEA